MCCFFATLMFFGPRLATLVWYIFSPAYVNAAFDHFIWGLLGWIFLPWTTLTYVAVYPRGLQGFDWIILGLGIFGDMAGYMGFFANKNRMPYGDQIPDIEEFTSMAGGSGSDGNM